MPVQFTLTKAGTPIQIVTIVDPNNKALIPTEEPLTVQAIVNGITTPMMTITDPNATVTAIADNNVDAFTLSGS